MHDPAMFVTATLTLLIFWTGSVIAVVVWLNTQFKRLNATIYREVNRIKESHNALDRRLLVIELKRNGVAEVQPRL